MSSALRGRELTSQAELSSITEDKSDGGITSRGAASMPEIVGNGQGGYLVMDMETLRRKMGLKYCTGLG